MSGHTPEPYLWFDARFWALTDRDNPHAQPVFDEEQVRKFAQRFAADQSAELLAALRAFLPDNLCTTNPGIPDDFIIPCDVPMADFRKARAAIAKATGGGS